MALARTLVIAAVAALVAGCGTYGDSDEVAGAVDSFLTTCAHDQPLQAEEALVQSGKDTFLRAGSPARGCATILRLPGAGSVSASRFAGGRVTGVRVHGAEATADVDVQGTRTTVELTYGEEGWRLDGPG